MNNNKNKGITRMVNFSPRHSQIPHVLEVQ